MYLSIKFVYDYIFKCICVGCRGWGGIWRESARWDEKYVVGGQLARGIWREYAGCHSRQLHIVGVFGASPRRFRDAKFVVLFSGFL